MGKNDYFLLSNGQPIAYAKYKKQRLTEYDGNPLIEALPEMLDKERTIEWLSSHPEWSESEKYEDERLRKHMIQRLSDYFQPWGVHITTEEEIDTLIRQGYRSRNPRSSDYSIVSHSIYKTIRNKGNAFEQSGFHSSTSAALTIIGYSGLGKTSSVGRIMSRYDQVICHQNYGGPSFNQYQVTWLKLECPSNGSLKTLCTSFFTQMGRLLDEDFYGKYVTSRFSAEVMIPHMEAIAHRHHLGVLIIDEIQNLTEAKHANKTQMLNFFTSLVNSINVPIILIGTNKAVQLLQENFRYARRAAGQFGIINFEILKKDRVWNLLLKGMWQYQWTQTYTELTDELSDALFEESQGIPAIAVVLFSLCQREAIRTKVERITKELIIKTAHERLWSVKPMLDALRNNDQNAFERFTDIAPINWEHLHRDEPRQDAISPPKPENEMNQPRPSTKKMPELDLPPICPNKNPVLSPNDLRTVTGKNSGGNSNYESLKSAGHIKSPTEF